MQFKAIKVKKGSFKILGLEEYFEAKILELKRSLGLVSKAVKGAPKKAAVKGTQQAPDEVHALLAALQGHKKRAALLKAGRAKDQLLRALIPLYLGRTIDLPTSSGLTSKFWASQGVKFAAPNAAKALRQHAGHARRTKAGPVITDLGIAYVEKALK